MCQLCQKVVPYANGCLYPAGDEANSLPDTGSMPFTAIAASPGRSPVDAITWGYQAPTSIDVYFVPGDATVVENSFGNATQTSAGWSAFERKQAMEAFQTFEAVANVDFNITTNPNSAEFFLIESKDADSALGYWAVGGGVITVNGATRSLDGWGVFYTGGTGWTPQSLEQGGFGFITLIHEIGHGLGLAHPHDGGGTSSVMAGVSRPFNDRGDFDLNQGINTTMTYNDGWQTAPHGNVPSLSYGYQGTPMALDIAALQAAYGANMSTNAGNTTYALPDTNGTGTFYQAIWDAGGMDRIIASGSKDATIDLRPATLAYEPGGGGHVSYAKGIFGGFTIAADVVIEQAEGAAGDDTLIGNDAANRLSGGGGNDTLLGGHQNDTLQGGAGFDRLEGGAGNDLLNGGGLGDRLIGGGGQDRLYGDDGGDRLFGGSGNDLLGGGSGADEAFGQGGNDTLEGGAGHDLLSGGANGDLLTGGDGADTLRGDGAGDRLFGGNGDDQLYGGTGSDRLFGQFGNDELFGEDGNDLLLGQGGADFLRGGAGNDRLEGGDLSDNLGGDTGDDILIGGAGADRIFGGGGHDTLTGGFGDDRLSGQLGADVFIFKPGHGHDVITDFKKGDAGDMLDLRAFGSGFSKAEDILTTASADPLGVRLTTQSGESSILLTGISLETLTSDDFLFA